MTCRNLWELILMACKGEWIGQPLGSLQTVFRVLWQQLMSSICLTGIEPHGNMVKQPAIFTVDTISAGQGDLMVFIEDPEGNREEVCTLSVLYGKVKLV